MCKYWCCTRHICHNAADLRKKLAGELHRDIQAGNGVGTQETCINPPHRPLQPFLTTELVPHDNK